jgi:hypothetical protein
MGLPDGYVGWRNWTFFGSDRGGRTAAVLASLVATCKRLGVDPFAYLRDVFEHLSSHPQSQLAELLPDHWKVAHRPGDTPPPAPAPSAWTAAPHRDRRSYFFPFPIRSPETPLSVPPAGWVRLSSLRVPARLPSGGRKTLGMRRLWPPGLADLGERPS